MKDTTLPAAAVLLPGTGTDARFITDAFGPALTSAGVEFIAVEPDPRRVVGSYLDALDSAVAAHGPILVAGVSIGAHTALNWAFDQPGDAAAVLAVMPGWTGPPADAPAAVSAALTARLLRADGIDAVTAVMRSSSPAWLGDILARSWQSQWPDFPHALDEAAANIAPTVEKLAAITVPVGIVGATDDAVHPFAVAQEWADHLAHAAITRVTLDEIGADNGVLGHRAMAALEQLFT